jgi:hypothetical protein
MLFIRFTGAYSQVYLILQPSVVPGFAFAWLQLISHRCFMPQLLLLKGQKGWPYMHRLVIALLLFLQPFLKHAQLNDSIRKLYKVRTIIRRKLILHVSCNCHPSTVLLLVDAFLIPFHNISLYNPHHFISIMFFLRVLFVCC